MVLGMATVKITITIEKDQLQSIRDLVEQGTSASVSGFVQHAIRVSLNDAAEWKQMLEDSLQRNGGPMTRKTGDPGQYIGG